MFQLTLPTVARATRAALSEQAHIELLKMLMGFGFLTTINSGQNKMKQKCNRCSGEAGIAIDVEVPCGQGQADGAHAKRNNDLDLSWYEEKR